MPQPHFTLSEPFEFGGNFWVANAPTPSGCVAGTLSFRPDTGVYLDLLGPLNPAVATIGARGDLVIDGADSAGHKVTLWSCLLVRGGASESYYVPMLLSGGHFNSPEEDTFDSCVVSFDMLKWWMNWADFVRHVDDPSRSSMSVRFSRPAPRDVPCSALPGHIGIRGSIETGLEDRGRFTAVAMPELHIRPEVPMRVEWMVERAHRLANLAALCCGTPVPFQTVQLTSRQRRDPRTSAQPARVDVIFNQSREPGPIRTPSLAGSLTVDVLLNENPNVFSCWFELCDTISPAIDLLLAVMAGRRQFIEVLFLFVTQAVETFDRFTNQRALSDPEEYRMVCRTLRKAMPPGTTPALRERLLQSLQFANEPALRQRLTRLAGSMEAPPIDAAYIRKIVDTRNYLTHYTPHLKLKAMDRLEMLDAVRRLRLMLQVLILRLVGIRESVVLNGLPPEARFYP